MTIQEIIAKLQREKQQQLPARFHCRAIMVLNITQYVELLAMLKKLNDISVVSVDELFSGADVMPNYQRLTEREYQNKWMILPGVSEYLRLFHASEESAQRFGDLWRFQSDASTQGRIIIPLWGCETLWYDRALRLCDDERQKEYLYDCTENGGAAQRMNVQILSGEFEQYMDQLAANHGYVSYGLKEWYNFWCEPQPDITDHLLLTKRFRSVRPTDGDVRLHVIRDTLSFIRENLTDGSTLNVENCPLEAQKCLFPSALSGKSTKSAILSALNVHEFLPLDIMGKWTNLSTGQKQLVFLWYVFNPDDSYLYHCISCSKDPEDLVGKILMAIFPTRVSHPEWVSDAQDLIAAVPIERNNDYFDALDGIPSLEERLDYLTCGTARERVYILHLVGQWLRTDPEGVLQSQKLSDLYPALATYLKGDYPDEMLKSYFERYKIFKLSNTLPLDEDVWFSGIDTDIYDLRYPVLCEEADDQTFVLWIDGLGVEWMPLLKWAMEASDEGNVVSVKVTRAQLPSETRYNEQWQQMALPYSKYDKLDKLAHKGVIDEKDYYACVEEQLHFVCAIVEKVNKQLKEYPRVLITGDHGTSRLAARFFHKLDGIPVPLHAEVGSHGRFCKISRNQIIPMQTQKQVQDGEANRYLVFSNYDHYTQSGFATGADDDLPVYGEIHGGASPEEMLVPVITVNSLHEMPLTAKWNMPGNSTKISNRRARCHILFSRPVSALQVKAGALAAECLSGAVPSKDWIIVFNGLKLTAPKTFDVTVLADGTLVEIDPVEIKPALGGGDPF